jgi:hypothetical protein
MRRGWPDRLAHPSDSDKHLPLPQPPAEGPEDGEDEEALHEGAGGAFEDAVAEPGPADAADPAGGLKTGSGRTFWRVHLK